ncbi:serine phosphatase RsbU (regulator of sigma subunit)/PAS domain-containing protein [Saccharothrix coeruleofusca]|uniref:SpoIIE family protein phosphatase n=1 Tax=Saccharothrix coeruleofusca TaxID=33919 RepID=UPI001AE482D7|nr:SpoIIE family protein phosphatase [Saccharothrix coeruleofusca]MBP2336554.1 serine phosphatase RsbU (regulator of sigma subunit)/PAS domain-containing protein [Saccharothrix coeruleofusca]
MSSPNPPGTGPATENTADRAGEGGLGRLAATVERLRKQVREANAAADGRALVELAKGVLVERLRCGPAQAARQLSELAEQAGLTVLELAADLVNQAAQDRFTEVVDQFLAHAVGEGEDRPAEAGDGTSAAVRLRTAESGALAAGDTQTVAESLLEHALTPLGATAVAIWSAGNDSSLTLAGFAGITPEEAARWRYVPPGVVTPARRALVERGAVWVEDLARSGLPSVAHRDLAGGGRVAVPAGAGGRVLGVLEICWPQPLEPQPQPVRRQVEALAELCAHTLETFDPHGGEDDPAGRALAELVDLADGLLDSALVLRPHLDANGELSDFRIHHVNRRFVDLAGRPRGAIVGALVLEVYPMAADDGSLFDKVEHVHATGEPFRAERMTLTELVDQVPLTVVAAVSISRHGDNVLVVWRVQDETARLANLLQHAQRLGRIGGFEESTATGEITWNSQLFALYGLPASADPLPLAQLPLHAHPDDAVAINRFLRAVLHHRRADSAAFRLQRPDGVTRHVRVIAEPVLDAAGRLLAVRGAYQDVSAQHWTEVALSATRDQLAHTEQQAAEHNRLALQLQQAIMPPAQPSIDAFGLRIAVRYRPAEQEHLVGGDWYDAVVLPSKQILVSVGDITGHGIKGATGMVVLRNALRGLAATGAGPAQLLTWLNVVAHHLSDNILATAICGLYDPQTRVLRWARAGHLPPVLVRGQHATVLPMLDGVLLGALAEVDYEEGQVQLEQDDVLLLYTDGLVERRDTPLDDCIEALSSAAAGAWGPLEERLDHLLTHSDADTDDDTCLLGIQML